MVVWLFLSAYKVEQKGMRVIIFCNNIRMGCSEAGGESPEIVQIIARVDTFVTMSTTWAYGK